MGVSESLQKLRSSGYSGAPSKEKDPEGPRIFKLMDEELDQLGEGDGEEGEYVVTGRVSGNQFTVISVKPAGGEEEEGVDDGMAQEMADKMGLPPMVRQSTMPSPS